MLTTAPVRSPFRLALTALAFAAPLLAARAAVAAPSAWASVGGGAMGWKQGTTTPDFRASGVLVLEAGVGTPAHLPVLVGGLFRVTPLLAS